MANVDKFFYQQAALELAQGQLDQALWLKVYAENPNSNDSARQALYCRQGQQSLLANVAKIILSDSEIARSLKPARLSRTSMTVFEN